MKKTIAFALAYFLIPTLALAQVVSGGVSNNLWKLVSGVLQPSSSAWTFSVPTITGTSTISSNLRVAGNLQVDGKFFAPVTLVTSGNATINGNLTITGTCTVNGTNCASQWTTLGNNIYYLTSSVGIGTTSPGSIFTVSATSSLSNIPLLDIMAEPTLSATSTAFRVLSNANVGVGSSTPWGLLSVNSNLLGSEPAFVVGSSTATKLVVTNNGDLGLGVTTVSPTSAGAPLFVSVGSTIQTRDAIIVASNSNNSPINDFYNFDLNNTSTSVGSGAGLNFGPTGSGGAFLYSSRVSTAASLYDLNLSTNPGKFIWMSKGNYGVGTTTPNWVGQFASSTASNTMTGQLALSDMGAGIDKKHWVFSSEGGNLYIGTSSDALATSTSAAFSLSNNGDPNFGGGTPSASCAGTCTFDASASDSSGTIFLTGVQTTVTMTFKNAKAFAPHCVASDNVTAGNYDASSTPTQVIFATSVSLGTASISYWCPL